MKREAYYIKLTGFSFKLSLSRFHITNSYPSYDFSVQNFLYSFLYTVLLSAIFFAAKISKIEVTEKILIEQQTKVYTVKGQLFFATVSDFPDKFNYEDEVETVIIDLTKAHLWDDSNQIYHY